MAEQGWQWAVVLATPGHSNPSSHRSCALSADRAGHGGQGPLSFPPSHSTKRI